jgi:signal transduction histidine kinase
MAEMVCSLVLDEIADLPNTFAATANDVAALEQVRRRLQASELARNELSRRMMDAQEAERTRISRELHDDIGQSLAILKIQIVGARAAASDHPERTRPCLHEFADRLDAIIRKVNLLSHDLHSSALEYLGLAAAVESHCRERSAQLSIPIQCHCTNVEKDLDSAIALAFLRIAQEAIHNAVKHSRATTIMVRLNGWGRYLNLEIFDDGVGFDIKVTRLSPGLGLISMRERIHLIGGAFNIFSSPGRGTRIVARAPITQNNILEPFLLESRSSDRARQEGPR